VQPLT